MKPATPEPFASWPAHDTVKVCGLMAGRLLTLLVGAVASMVLTTVGVLIGALTSKTTVAWLSIAVVSAMPLIGRAVNVTKPSPWC